MLWKSHSFIQSQLGALIIAIAIACSYTYILTLCLAKLDCLIMLNYISNSYIAISDSYSIVSGFVSA